MVAADDGFAWISAGSAAGQSQPPPQRRITRLAERNRRAHHYSRRHTDRTRTLIAGYERLRNSGAGLSGTRFAEAQESEARGQRYFPLQHAVHIAGLVFRRDADPGFGEAEISG